MEQLTIKANSAPAASTQGQKREGADGLVIEVSAVCGEAQLQEALAPLFSGCECFGAKLLLLLHELQERAAKVIEFTAEDRKLAQENLTKVKLLREVTQVKDDYNQAFHVASAVRSTAPGNWCAVGQDPPKQEPHTASLDDLRVQAEAAKLPFFLLLQAAEDLVNAEHRAESPLPLKEEKRSLEKICKDYEGQACRLLDIVRGSIICRNFEEMQRIIEWLQTASLGATIIRIKSGFTSEYAELTYGYRDVKVRYEFSKAYQLIVIT
jgi:hypothetical protein